MFAAVVLCIYAGLGLASSTQDFEPTNFNATAALIELGLDAAELPRLSGFEELSSDSRCLAACKSLSAVYGTKAVYSEGQGKYDEFTGAYWSTNQANVNPECIFIPEKTADISVLVLLSRLTRCPFAVKSGGHAAFAGSSSIERGITVSLQNFHTISLSQDRKTVKIQPGNDWGSVYRELKKYDLTVAGGRVSRVGTGGLTLGGGISFFSNIHGWACDNVVAYEVVTATGVIVQASPHSYPDLYWALRGGGNNFGIVMSFTFETISLPGGEMWGGTKTYLEADFEQVVDAFAGVIAHSPKDPNAGIWVAWVTNSGLKLAATEFWYAKPEGSAASIFKEFDAITAIADTTQNRILDEYTDVQQESNPYGLREVYWAITVKADSRIGHIARDIFFEELPAVEKVEGVNPVLIFQGITEGQLRNMEKNGGNPLGLNYHDGPLYLMHVACWWEKEADDKSIYTFISKVLTRIEAEARAINIQNDYIYMNYGSQFENVIASYGSDSVKKLRSIGMKYDRTRVFQNLQPGHFKLDRAPVPNSGYFSSS